MLQQFKLFDSHFHIIDSHFPLVKNQGFMPAKFSCEDYITKMADYKLCGGAVVSGSFQEFDQSYLINALQKLGSKFVGVTQVPMSITDKQLIELNNYKIRAIRFNLKRNKTYYQEKKSIIYMAKRVYELFNWHIEFYIDSNNLKELYETIVKLPAVSIDHLGLNKESLPLLSKLAEKNVHIKVTGFGRIDFNIRDTLKKLYSINPNVLMFGTDLPSTRATRPYNKNDFLLVADTFENNKAQKIFYENAINFYTKN